MKTIAVKTLVAGVLAVGVMVSPTLATIRSHQANANRRISQGAKKHQLTPREQQRLNSQQLIIEAERRQARSDGKMTHREHQDIRHDQKRLSQDIWNKRHNAKRVRAHGH